MRDFQTLLKLLKKEVDKRGTKAIAKDAGVHFNTVYKMVTAKNRDVRYSTLKALDDYFNTQLKGTHKDV